ncbi:MAG: hypothetical protein ACT4QA_23195 [Panacagrimonas sp.]
MRLFERLVVFILVWMGWGCSAHGQNLSPVSGQYPESKTYTLYRDLSQANVFVVAPNLVKLDVDTTGKVRIGVQLFDLSDGTKRNNLAITLSFRFDSDDTRLGNLGKWVKSTYGAGATSGTTSGLASTCNFYLADDSDAGAKIVAAFEGDVTADAVSQSAATYTVGSLEEAIDVLRSTDKFGLLCRIAHKQIGEKKQEVIVTPEALWEQFQDVDFVGLDEDLEAVAKAIFDKLKIDPSLRPLAEPYFRGWFRQFIGLPTPKRKLMGGVEWGWRLAEKTYKEKLDKLGRVTLLSIGPFVSNRYKYSIIPLNNLCAKYPSHILNLDTGAIGCDEDN